MAAGPRFFFSSRRRHTRLVSDWSSDVCSSDLVTIAMIPLLEVSPLGPTLAGRDRITAEGHHGRRARASHQRSEERRVGKECRSRWSRYHEKTRMDKGGRNMYRKGGCGE